MTYMLPQSLALSDSAINNVSTRCNKLKAYAQKLWSSRTRLAYRANILQNVGCAFEGLLSQCNSWLLLTSRLKKFVCHCCSICPAKLLAKCLQDKPKLCAVWVCLAYAIAKPRTHNNAFWALSHTMTRTLYAKSSMQPWSH